jgi:uncharacterized protein (TIGR02118 family)
MIKFSISFKHPQDPESFESTYQDFLALAERMPNIQRRQVVHVLGSPFGKTTYSRVLEFYFADVTILQESLRSTAGQEAGAELNKFEAGLIDLFYGDVYEA